MRVFLLTVLYVVIVSNCIAQTLDNNYKPEILTAGYINDILPIDGGKFMVAGDFSQFNSSKKGCLVRLNADLTVDESFNASGLGATYTTLGDEVPGRVRRILKQADGKYIITGDFYKYNGVERARIARLNADGTLDNSFVPPPLPTGSSSYGNNEGSMAIQADGKVLMIQGNFQTIGGSVFTRKILRLNTDGTIDNSFTAVEPNSAVSGIALQSTGKILVSGSMTTVNGTSAPYFFRLNTNGTIDNTFQIGVGPDNNVDQISVRADDKILLSGGFYKINNVNTSRVTLLNADGTIDNSFTNSTDGVFEATTLPNGQVVIAGRYLTVKKLNANGTQDKAYVGSPNEGNDRITKTVMLPDGKILVGCIGRLDSKYYFRLNADLTLDDTFTQMGPVSASHPLTMTVQPDGKPILLGGFMYYNGVRKNGIVRLNTDLSIDETFVTGIGFDDQYTPSAVVQDDGGIVIQTQSKSYNGMAFTTRMRRLTSTGAVDPTYTASTNFYSTMIKAKGSKIIAFSENVSFNGNSQRYLVRLNSDGTNDNTFTPKFDGRVSVAAAMKNGKVVVYGSYAKLNDVTAARLLRLNEDGTLDPSFAPKIDINASSIGSMSETPDGKLLLFGDISTTTSSGSKRSPVVRLLDNGDLDGTFILIENSVEHQTRFGFILKDNSLLLSTVQYALLRLNPDGTKLSIAAPPTANAYILNVAQISNTSFVVSGDFSKINNVSQGAAKFDFVPVTPPLAPTNLTGVVKGTDLDLTWEASVGATKYEIEKNDGTGYVKAGESTTNSFKLTNLSEMTSYKVRVRALGPGGTSGYSNEATLVTVVGIEGGETSLVSVYPNPALKAFSSTAPYRVQH
jgi:uncharacterized delta-60 repeat protein